MKTIAALLLLGVFLRHHAANWLASVSGFSPAAVFYMLGGLWEAVLCGLIFAIALAARPSLWASLVKAAMLIGMVESIQIPLCRLAVHDIRQVPTGANLCDFATGLPVGAAILALYFIVLCWELGKSIYADRTA